ncbi:MAG: SDR family oxidoreductase [Acidimicrobiales bacterium]|nr:SDR family oxidoreductase [Acidimicrobiales bacterium]MDG1878224.1 SDR family oxidoreductase [Acidimicrobiales bacterium]
MTDLSGRTVLITGGNGGIGLGIGTACAAAGANIVAWGRSPEKNAAAQAKLRALGVDAHVLKVDASDEAAIDSGFAESVDRAGGRIDSVFANAGVGGSGARFPDVTLEEWRRVMTTNLDGVFLLFRAAAHHMIEHEHGGALVATSSTSAIHGAAGNEAYGTSKTALLGFCRALAVNLARHQIRVNALLPGWTVTELASFGYANDKFRDATLKRTPVRRWADPNEMGAAGVFLADPTATYHTGDSIVVDGGYTIF